MNNLNFIHILHSQKAVAQLVEMLDDKNNDNNFILGSDMGEIISLMRKKNAQSFLLKIKEHLAYYSYTDKTFIKNPNLFTMADYMGFEDSFEVYMLNSDKDKDFLEVIFYQLKSYLDSCVDEKASFYCF